MLRRDRLRDLRRRLASEAGFAVPTALLAIVAAFGLASAAVVSSISAQSGSVRDQNTKAALASAEAGVANAMLRYNRVSSESEPCAPVGGTATDPQGWCPTEVVGDLDRGGFTYRVHPTPTELEIVATGSVDGVVRRVNAVAASAQGGEKGLAPFAEASVVGLDGILLNSKATIDASVATNGNIGLNANSDLLCDSAQVGEGKGISPNNNGTITCTPHEGVTTLPPVNAGDVATNNSNDRICTLDPITPPEKQCNQAWFPSEKRLTLNSGMAITLGAAGGEFNYFFCQVTLNSNSYMHIAGGAKVRIYFGNEEDGCQSWHVQSPLIINSNSKILPTGAGAPDLAILVSGPGPGAPSWLQSRVVLNSNAILFDCDQSFVLYAPDTEVIINSNTHVCGGVAAKSIIVNSNSSIAASNTAEDFELPGAEPQYFLGYGPPEFVECTAAIPSTSDPPDMGC